MWSKTEQRSLIVPGGRHAVSRSKLAGHQDPQSQAAMIKRGRDTRQHWRWPFGGLP